MTHSASDEALLAGFLSGDEAMFAELVHRYERPLHAFICRLTGEPAIAPDLFQETFLRVVQHAGRFEGRSRFKTWLYAIAANQCRSHVRKQARRRLQHADAVPDPADAGPGPNGTAQAAQIGEHIARAVAVLPPAQREVFVLRTYDEMPYAQIAETLGRPLGTVKTQMRAALQKLRKELHAIAEAYGVS